MPSPPTDGFAWCPWTKPTPSSKATYDSKLNLRSYQLTVSMDVRFRDLKRSELLWQQNGLTEQVAFDVAGQVSETISREEGAVKQAALEIGRKVVSHAVDSF